MIHLITGGAGSGKSEYAESQILSSGCRNRLYIATMSIGTDPENIERVRRHRERRKDMGFQTIECSLMLSEITVPEDCAILLEDLPNLLANELYLPNGSGIHAISRILHGIDHLASSAGKLVIVTDDVFADGCHYERSTLMYMQLLGLICQNLTSMADRVTEVVYGIPIEVKR